MIASSVAGSYAIEFGDAAMIPASTAIVLAISRYATAPTDDGACSMIERPTAGASAKRTDRGTEGLNTLNP